MRASAGQQGGQQQFKQLAGEQVDRAQPLVSIAVGFVYAEETGSGDVFRIEKTDQVGGFAARKNRWLNYC
ncbi:MAG TPA: hypothetical protein VK910_10065 [Thiobacillus sp.]|nr:hypothetical protein [Thiobacillus sp.]